MGKSRGPRFGLLVALVTLLLASGAVEPHLQADGGAILTYWLIPTAGSLPLGVAVDPAHGLVYFAEAGGDKLGRLDPTSNVIVEWAVGDGPAYLEIEPASGLVYFTEYDGNRVSRLSPAINGYSYAIIPTVSSAPNGLKLNPTTPTEIFFTERLGGKVGRLATGGLVFDLILISTPTERVVAPTSQALTPTTAVVTPLVTPGSPRLPPAVAMIPGAVSGPFTEWPFTLSVGSPAMIIQGPDGHFWVSTETRSILEFIPESNIFYFHDLPSGSVSLDLAIDESSNIWFTESWVDRIGRLNPSNGDVTEWPLRSGSQPFAIAIGPDGRIWFSEREGDRIGSLDPSTNTITEYQLASDAHPLDIAFDGAGNLWFTTERGNYLGRLTLGPLLGPPPTAFDAIGLAEVMAAAGSLSSAKINGSDNASNQIPAGTILLYQTNEGRYGKLQIVSYGYNLTLKWRTYNPDGSLYSGGDHLVIRGTWSCDLDLGVESDASADFWWEQVTAIERYLVPRNGARFAIYGAAPPPAPSGLPTLSLSINRGCGGNYSIGEPLTFSYSVSETAAVTLLDFETSGNIKQMALGTVPAGMSRSGTGVVGGPAGVETLVLVARTLSGVYVSTGCSFGIGGVSPSLVSITVDRGCNGTYHLGEAATVTLQSGISGQVRLYNVTRDGRLTQIPVFPGVISPGLGLTVSAPFSGAIGRNTLVMQVATGSGVLTAACSTNVLP